MLDQAYEQGVNDALEYIEKVAAKKMPKGGFAKFVGKMKNKMKAGAGAVKAEAKSAYGAAKKHKVATGLGLAGAAGAGYGARKATED